jgi:hypothetical protein
MGLPTLSLDYADLVHFTISNHMLLEPSKSEIVRLGETMRGTGLEVPMPKQLCAWLAENVSCIITLRDNGIRSQQQWRQLMATEILCEERCNTPSDELRLWHHTYSFQPQPSRVGGGTR